MNAVALIGNLATDVDLRAVAEDRKVASFLLAIDRRSKEGGADFIRVKAWERQAELCAQYLGKGRRVAVEGRLRSDSWEDADGKKRRSVDVVAYHVEFLSSPGEREEVPFEASAAS